VGLNPHLPAGLHVGFTQTGEKLLEIIIIRFSAVVASFVV